MVAILWRRGWQYLTTSHLDVIDICTNYLRPAYPEVDSLGSNLFTAFQEARPLATMTIQHEFDDSDSVINDTGRGFLGGLTPDVIPSYPYRGRAQFLRDYNRALSTICDENEWFILTDIDKQIFTTVFEHPESGECSSWTSYDVQLQLLLIKMPPTAHGIATGVFGTILMDALEPMGMKWSLCPLGDSKHIAEMGAKKPDQAWIPLRVPRGQSRTWPTLVLEVGLSETKAKLQRDVRFWHHASEGRVKVILTIHINRNRPEISIEKWETGANNRCKRIQRIVMSKRERGTTCVAGGPLVIDFAKLFLRQPDLPKEQDISIGDEDLDRLARFIWHGQEF